MWIFFFHIAANEQTDYIYVAVIIKQIRTLGKSLTYLVALGKSIIKASFHVYGRKLSQALLSIITVPLLHSWGSITV